MIDVLFHQIQHILDSVGRSVVDQDPSVVVTHSRMEREQFSGQSGLFESSKNKTAISKHLLHNTVVP